MVTSEQKFVQKVAKAGKTAIATDIGFEVTDYLLNVAGIVKNTKKITE